MSSMYFFSGARANQSTNHEPYIVGAIDLIDPATGLGTYGGKSLEATRLQYPDVTIVPYEEALARSEDACIKGPWEIDSHRFFELLGEGTPGRRTYREDDESFYVTERLIGRVVMWAICIGADRFFEMRDRSTLDHQSVVGECRKFMQRTESSASQAPSMAQ